MAWKVAQETIDRFFEPETDKELVGRLTGYQSLANGGKVLVFETESGERVGAGQYGIVAVCGKYSVGTLFKIDYRGTTEKSGGRMYHNFRIQFDDETGKELTGAELENRLKDWGMELRGRSVQFIEELPF